MQPAARSPQPAARSPQPAARSPQPAARSPQSERLRTTGAVLSFCVAVSGCATEERVERTGVSRQAIGNGDTDSNGKYNSVVQVNVAGRGNCSGVLVTPFHVLTANHCVTGATRDGLECVIAVPTELGDDTVAATLRFFLAGNGFFPLVPTLTVGHQFAQSGPILVRTIDSLDLCVQSEAAKDVALIRLDQRVSTQLFNPTPPPILGVPGFTQAPSCLGPVNPDDFVAVAVGYGRDDFDLLSAGFSQGNDARLRKFKETEDWFRTNDVLRNEWLATSTYEGNLKGDSGGGLFVNGRLCGVASRFFPIATPPGVAAEYPNLESSGNQAFLRQHLLDVSQTHFVGLCNADDPNPWNDVALENTDTGDGDGMPDACDPCPFLAEGDIRGDFSRGFDKDDDGVPDHCDNCPPSLCEARGLNPIVCRNPYPTNFGPQADFDNDGIGDACDSCPMVPNPGDAFSPAFVDDPDNDKVGKACDNCGLRNSVTACSADADCTYTTVTGVIKSGFCIDKGRYGRCNDADAWACLGVLGNADCRDNVTCAQPTSFGRCSQQQDDLNDNQVGGACDSCDAVAGVTILANSNRHREGFEDAPAFGDACDPVPVFASRGVLDVPNNGGYDPFVRTRFLATTGVGVDPTTGGQPQLFGTTGFRWCDCRINGESVPLDECLDLHCVRNPTVGYAPGPGQTTSWARISTRAYSYSPTPLTSGSFPGTGSDQTVSRFFNGAISATNALYAHGETEQQRVGLLLNVLWDHAADIASGAVHSYQEAGQTLTAGAFWSHVEESPGLYASQRDEDYYKTKGISLGGLRDHYYYVTTPQYLIPFDKVLAVPACETVGCLPSFRGDLLRDPTISPVSPGLRELGPGGGLIACTGGCAVIGPHGWVDLTSAISPPVQELFLDQSLSFLSPVERGVQLFGASPPPATTMTIAVARDWTPLRAPIDVQFNGVQLSLATRMPGSPSARTAPRYVWSAKQSALYLVGGRLPDGSYAREVWRLDLASNEWVRILQPASTDAEDPAPVDIQAVGYDPGRRQLVFVDHAVVPKITGKKLLQVPVARLVVLDVATREARVVLTLPRNGLLPRIALAARGDGTWVLVGQVKQSNAWKAFQFSLDQNGALSWRGAYTGSGLILDGPINTSDGLLLPVRRGARHDFDRLEANAFNASPAGPTHL